MADNLVAQMAGLTAALTADWRAEPLAGLRAASKAVRSVEKTAALMVGCLVAHSALTLVVQ